MHRPPPTRLSVLARLALACVAAPFVLAGCAATDTTSAERSQSAPPPARVEIPAGGYESAFDATREVLLDYRFALDRVDADQGVITTAPKGTAGLLTPWDSEQQSLRDEWRDAVALRTRRVRVEFLRADQPPPARPVAPAPGARENAVPSTPPPADLRRHAGPVVAQVRVDVVRSHLPEWRLNGRSVRRSSFAVDALGARAGTPAGFATLEEPDHLLAGALAAELARRLGVEAPTLNASAPVASPSEPTRVIAPQPAASQPAPRAAPSPVPPAPPSAGAGNEPAQLPPRYER